MLRGLRYLSLRVGFEAVALMIAFAAVACTSCSARQAGNGDWLAADVEQRGEDAPWVALEYEVPAATPHAQPAALAPGHRILPDGSTFVADQANPVSLVVVPETPLIVALATPVVAVLGSGGSLPALLVMEEDLAGTGDDAQVCDRLRPERVLALYHWTPGLMSANMTSANVDFVRTPTEPTEASLLLATLVWGQSERAVLADSGSERDVIVGASLAAHEGIPLLLAAPDGIPHLLAEAKNRLGVIHAMWVGAMSAAAAESLTDEPVRVERLTRRTATMALLGAIEPRRTCNVILCRVPDEGRFVGRVSWLAPFWSLVRGSPIVLVHSGSAREAEERVREFVGEWNLDLGSVTVLGAQESVGDHEIRIARQRVEYVDEPVSGQGDYEMQSTAPEDDYESPEEVMELRAELFSLPSRSHALSLSVGRMPFRDLTAASRFMVNNVIRSRSTDRDPSRAVMLANPRSEYGALPLCEVVSRATANELRNSGVTLDEFYRVRTNTPEVTKAAERAHLIIFEGHIYDLRLFQDDVYGDGFYSDADDGGDDGYDNTAWEYEGMPPPDERGFPAETVTGVAVDPDNGGEEAPPYAAGQTYMPPAWDTTEHDPGYGGGHVQTLTSCAVIVLQSCHSLEDHTLDRLTTLGASAMVGSTTNVHSGSGSAFVKAFVDRLVYSDATIGEAVRDARNYFFCLQDLKDARGHKQQAKALRVALSFRLWGDPDLVALPIVPEQPGVAPSSSAWTSPEEVRVQLSRRRLPAVSNEKYTAKWLAGAAAAGLVRSVKGETTRQVLPLHFFRLGMHPAFAQMRYSALMPVDGEANRTVFRVSEDEQFVYVLYFPKKDRAGEEISFRFSR